MTHHEHLQLWALKVAGPSSAAQPIKKVKLGNDKEMAQIERNSCSKKGGGKNKTDQNKKNITKLAKLKNTKLTKLRYVKKKKRKRVTAHK